MLVCCERDIDITDFRRALEEHCITAVRHQRTQPESQSLVAHRHA